jgi:hypothetical protein
MAGTYANMLNITQPVALGAYLERLQGRPVAEQFLKQKDVPQEVFRWYRYGTPGGMTPMAGDTSRTPDAFVDYEPLTKRCIEYREGAVLGEKMLKGIQSERDVQADVLRNLSERMVLRREFLVIKEFLDQAATTFDIAASGEGRRWNEANANPIEDIISMGKQMRAIGHAKPDIMIMNFETFAELQRNPALLTFSQSGEFATQSIVTGKLGQPQNQGAEGRILGMDIFVTDAFYFPKNLPYHVNSSPKFLLDGSVVFLRQDPDLGFMAVFEPYEVRNFPDQDRRAIVIQNFMTMTPVIQRPEYVGKMTNVLK